MELGGLDILMFNFASNYFAQEYGVEVSPVWAIIAVITSSLLAIALPPPSRSWSDAVQHHVCTDGDSG